MSLSLSLYFYFCQTLDSWHHELSENVLVERSTVSTVKAECSAVLPPSLMVSWNQWICEKVYGLWPIRPIHPTPVNSVNHVTSVKHVNSVNSVNSVNGVNSVNKQCQKCQQRKQSVAIYSNQLQSCVYYKLFHVAFDDHNPQTNKWWSQIWKEDKASQKNMWRKRRERKCIFSIFLWNLPLEVSCVVGVKVVVNGHKAVEEHP